MTEENKNPFSDEFMSGSQVPDSKADFHVNQFSSEQAPFPQFGNIPVQDNIRERIEAAKSNGWGSKLSGLARSHNKKLLIFAAMALLFIGGSYLTDRNDTENAPAVENEDVSRGFAAAKLGTDKDARALGENDVPVNVLDIKIDEGGEVIFSAKENEESGDSITKTASRGDGITHLARSAIKDYLAQSGKTLSAEQKIYAEDYAQNRIGSESLEVGQKISFSKDLLREAVEKSQDLTVWQIENLKQYTANVSLL
jgi:hypothetical protein